MGIMHYLNSITKSAIMFLAYLFIYFFCSKSKATLATFGGLRHFYAIALWLTPHYPCMTFDPSNALHSGQGFFVPNLVAIEHFQMTLA